jgi:ribonuclease-3
MNLMKPRHKPIEELAKRLRLRVAADALERAFLHSSYVNEVGDTRGSNERLEFLGDAVIDLAVTSHLYNEYPDADEGRLTKAKSVAVSRPILAEKAAELGFSEFIRLGRGEEANGGRTRPTNLGNAFEALIAVLYLERGYAYAAKFVIRHLREDIRRYLAELSTTGDYKSLLQETAQRLFDCRPSYSVVKASGKEHKKEFTVGVSVAGHRGVGRGRSKKEAEQAAAKQLYLMLEEF